MQNVGPDTEMRRALRAQVCTTCPMRPKGSEALGASIARTCETSCTIFENLDALKSIARQFQGDPLADYERAIRDSVCQHCTATPSAGDYCSDRLARTCPLSVQESNVLTVLESLLPELARVS